MIQTTIIAIVVLIVLIHAFFVGQLAERLMYLSFGGMAGIAALFVYSIFCRRK